MIQPTVADPLPGRPRSRVGQFLFGGVIKWILLGCTLLSILTTLFIVIVLATEAVAFLAMESVDF